MRRRLALCFAVAALLAPACAVSGAGGAKATSLGLAVETFPAPKVLVATSMPPGFDLVFEREMPTPGWQIVVDAVEIDGESGRIVARVSELPPVGMSAQVITATTCRVPLGVLEIGRYLLEVHSRRGGTGPYTLVQAFVLVAR